MQKELPLHCRLEITRAPKEFVRIAALRCNQKWDVLRQKAGEAVQNEELSSKGLEETFVI